MPQPKVSVIVPVYNVARYLPQCLESLMAQTLEPVEFLLINDGSTDGSAEILQAFAAKDSRFKIVEQENQGVAATRNTGLAQARGEFIGFVDGDDWVEPDMFAHLLALAESQNAELAQCGFSWYLEQEDRHVPRDSSWIPPLLAHAGGRLRGAESILFEDIALWKKLYHRNLIEATGLRFDEQMSTGEDAPIQLATLCLANRIVASDRPLYHYRKQRTGQLTGLRDARLLAYFRIFEKLDDLLRQHDLTYLQPWLLHLQLSRHCWGYEMATPDVRLIYFQRLRERFQQAKFTVHSPIAPGCWRYGTMGARLRWLSLRMIHPMALKAILQNDQPRFERIIRLRMFLQNPMSIFEQ
jgi:hypothetical protein